MARLKIKDGDPIWYRLTQEERGVLDAAAERSGMSTNMWCRVVALREARAPEAWREVEIALRVAGIEEEQIAVVRAALES